jgi:hypothetical protein
MSKKTVIAALCILLAGAGLIYGVLHDFAITMILGDTYLLELLSDQKVYGNQGNATQPPTSTSPLTSEDAAAAFEVGMRVAKTEWNPQRPNQKAVVHAYRSWLQRHNQPTAQLDQEYGNL